VPAETEPPKYPISYGEEVRQALGLHNGRIAIFAAPLAHGSGAAAPAFSAGLSHDGISLRLDW
jgi:hypothetical protein